MNMSVMPKNCFAFWRWRSQWALTWSEYACFYYIYLFLQSNLVWWYILICLSVIRKKMDGCVRSRSHKTSKCCSLFVWTESSKLLNLNYKTWWCSDASSWAGVKRLICCCQGQGHSEGFIWSNYYFLLRPLNCWSFCNQIWFDGRRWIVFWKD